MEEIMRVLETTSVRRKRPRFMRLRRRPEDKGAVKHDGLKPCKEELSDGDETPLAKLPDRPRRRLRKDRTIAYPCFFRGSRRRQLTEMRKAVWEGKFYRTSGGLTKEDLFVNMKGVVVPKRRSAHSQEVCRASGMADWYSAMRAARKKLGLTGFVLVKRNGTMIQDALYRAAIEYMVEKQTQAMNEALKNSGSNLRFTALRPEPAQPELAQPDMAHTGLSQSLQL